MRIPSTQSSQDFIFRVEVDKGDPARDPDNPHLLVIDGTFNPSTCSDEPIGSLGAFHSLDATVFRDGKQANDVDLLTFHHRRNEMTFSFSLEFSDPHNIVCEHTYLVTVILRYLA
ncbi:MAG: hypothetical protein NTV56_18810 [Alphaproteobacteria bacterium]|nr:hypothetical protein [Alphaproteobacteria bacterium]